MSLLATIALAASGATLPACSWDRPGVDPFVGDVVAAVDDYKDIPVETRNKLKARMAKRDYDEIVSIKRDSISGQGSYSNDIRDMHYGAGNVCKTVSRLKWSAKMEERGLVYCEDGQCILVPTVCRNVSRIRRAAAPLAIAPGAGNAPAAAAAPPAELEMEPPSAGLLPGGAPGAGPTSFAQLAGPSLDSGLPMTPGTLLPAPDLPPGIPGGPVIPFIPTLPPGVVPVPPTTPPTNPEVPVIPPAVPEPGTWALLLSGAAVIAFVARRRRAA